MFPKSMSSLSTFKRGWPVTSIGARPPERPPNRAERAKTTSATPPPAARLGTRVGGRGGGGAGGVVRLRVAHRRRWDGPGHDPVAGPRLAVAGGAVLGEERGARGE